MKKLVLPFFLLVLAQSANAQCNELFFSEYVEGAGNNKALEIYNPTTSAVNLSNYRIVRYSNGSSIPSDSLLLSGTLAPGAVWVVVNGQTTGTMTSPACDPALQALADQLSGVYPDPLYMNGNDAVTLVKFNTTRVIVDILGKIGEDPGQSWTDVFPYTDAQGAYWTKDHTLKRKQTVMQGVTINPLAFNPTLEWDSLPEGTWTGLGAHTSNCPTSIREYAAGVKMEMFPNPVTAEGSFTIKTSSVIIEVQIFTIAGQLISTIKPSGNEQQLDLSTQGMAKGMYFVKVRFSNGFLAEKLNVF